jgi:hypothetical protein
MAELLILEFDRVTESEYRNVNAELGIDPETGKGDWPAGLITHLAGLAEGRAFVVESWTSREAQAEFMQNRLGAALGRGGVAATPKGSPRNNHSI